MFVLIPVALNAIFISTSILQEKVKSLRKGMMTMGMNQGVYWFSWGFLAFINGVVIAFLLDISGRLF